MKKMILATLAVTCVLGMSGCVSGSNGFVLTKKVYTWNKSLDGEWVQELVFLVANIVPVYSISAFIDAIVLNSIDFWTGENPALAKTLEMDGQKVVMTKQDDGSILVSSEKGAVRLVKTGEHVTAHNMDGDIVTAL